MANLLQGVRVIEAAVLLVGDYLGMLLADEGADVLKIESPRQGDYIRSILGELTPGNSPFHVFVNRGKRSMTLDMRHSDSRAVFHRLASEADVFITGYVGDVPLKLGMDYDSLKAINPDIVYCQATGFGAEGPYSAIPTHGSMMDALGNGPVLKMDPHGRVARVSTPSSSGGMVLGPLFGAYAIAAGLVRRDRTGEGCYIDVSCSDAGIAGAWPGAVGALNRDRLNKKAALPIPAPEQMAASAKYQYYETQDHKYVLFCPIEAKFWTNFCRAVDREDLIPRHAAHLAVDYGLDQPDLRDEIQAIFHTRTQSDWSDLFIRYDIAGAPSVTIAEVDTDPHLQAREAIITEEHPAAGPVKAVGNPIHVRGEKFELRRHAPALGEHTDQVLAELGYSLEEIERLHQQSVV